VNRCDLPFQGGELAVGHAVPGHSLPCAVLCRAVPPTWPPILFVVLGMYWLARSVMQADGFGTLLDACLLALCLILIAVKIMNPRGEAGDSDSDRTAPRVGRASP
jgi:hypothetical protein